MKIHYQLSPLSFEQRAYHQSVLMDALDRQSWYSIHILSGGREILACIQ
jgi:hypothetical protein